MNTRPLHLFLLLSLAVPTNAQVQVELTGVVERVSGTPCLASATHQVRCTNVLLSSHGVDLTPWEGRTVELTGTPAVSLTCSHIEVATVRAASSATLALAVFGFRPGRPVVFTTTTSPGALVSYFFGTGPGYLPLGSFGSLLLDPRGLVYWTTDISIGIALRTLPIPNDPALIGVQVRMQPTVLTLSPLGGRLLNPTCFAIQ